LRENVPDFIILFFFLFFFFSVGGFLDFSFFVAAVSLVADFVLLGVQEFIKPFYFDFNVCAVTEKCRQANNPGYALFVSAREPVGVTFRADAQFDHCGIEQTRPEALLVDLVVQVPNFDLAVDVAQDD